jgi:hypothetical protein
MDTLHHTTHNIYTMAALDTIKRHIHSIVSKLIAIDEDGSLEIPTSTWKIYCNDPTYKDINDVIPMIHGCKYEAFWRFSIYINNNYDYDIISDLYYENKHNIPKTVDEDEIEYEQLENVSGLRIRKFILQHLTNLFIDGEHPLFYMTAVEDEHA